MRKYVVLVLGLALLLAMSAPAAFAVTTIYSQPWDGGSNLFASQNDTNGNGNFATTYDNFTLAAPAQVTDVHWVGGYFNPPNQSAITTWTVNFLADNAGQPGTILSSYTFSGTGNESFVSNVNGFPIYDYSVDLTSPFSAAAGTSYWLSVVPTLGFPPQWGWAAGTGGDGQGYQNFFGTLGPTSTDFAFSLTGVASVPAPPGLLLLASGVLGLTGLKRRFKR